MSKPYSMDLRERVVAAVETGGMSRRQAAAHFGVSYSAAIAWVDRLRTTRPGSRKQANNSDLQRSTANFSGKESGCETYQRVGSSRDGENGGNREFRHLNNTRRAHGLNRAL